MKSWNSFQ